MRNMMLAATAIAGFAALGAAAQAADLPIGTDSFASGLASGAALAPGDIVVRLKALIQIDGTYSTDSATKTSTGKNSGVFLGDYVRLYPKFDAKLQNGLEYGATFEIRMNSSGTSTGGSTLYARRYNVYAGTAALGRLYVGPENNAFARAVAGTTMEDFDYNGGFNGDFSAGQPGYAAYSWTTPRSGGFYTTNKIVYISPSFSGFSIGVGFEPNQTTGEASLAAGGTTNPTSSTLSTNTNTRRNTVDFGVRYAGSLGPVALTAGAGYITSGRVLSNQAASAQTDSNAPYKNLSVFAVGSRVTYGPFAVGGLFTTGAMNTGTGLIRQGQKNISAIITGAQYTIGPVIFGFQYVTQTAGGVYSTLTPRAALREYGITFGGAYDFAPGATLYGNVFYDQRHQYGVNLVTATAATSTASARTNNNVQSRGLLIGTAFKW